MGSAAAVEVEEEAAGAGGGRRRQSCVGAAVVVAWLAVPAPPQPWRRTITTTGWCPHSWSTSAPRGASRSRPSRRMTCQNSRKVSTVQFSISLFPYVTFRDSLSQVINFASLGLLRQPVISVIITTLLLKYEILCQGSPN